ncbi:His Kinase A domain containing protein [Podila verticillata]|nr:His Kinase A domain containing protein [Podila verticillata]
MPPDSLEKGYDLGLPVAQVFLIFDTNKAYQETIKVETQKDSFGNFVVYWTDIMHLYENAIYLKDNNGMVATFVKNDSGDTRVPLRVLYNRDPLRIIVHKAPPDHTIVPLSKGLRIDPERTLSASTRIRKTLYRALFRTNSVPIAPINSTGIHYYSQMAPIVTEKTGDSQLVKISEGLSETMLLPPTMQAPARLASHMPSTALINAQKASGTPREYQPLPLPSSMMTTSVVDPASLPLLPDRVQARFLRASSSPASLAPCNIELEDDPQEQHQPQQQQQEQQPVISLRDIPHLHFLNKRYDVKGVLRTSDRTPAIATTSEDGYSWPSIIEKDRWAVEESSASAVPAAGMGGGRSHGRGHGHGRASSTSFLSPKSQRQLLNGDSSHISSSNTLVTPPPAMDQEPRGSDRPLPRVLIVEDNITNRMILRTFLKKRGIGVVEAENGKIGVERFQEEVQRRQGRQGFEFVLMDLQMPIMDGNIATKQIREFEQKLVKEHGLSPEVQQTAVESHRLFVSPCSVADVAVASSGYRPTIIFALTVLAADKDKRLAFACGVDGYLTKPVNLKTLASLLTSCHPENVEGMTRLADMPPIDQPEVDAPRSASGEMGNSLNINSYHSLPVPYSKSSGANVFNTLLLGETRAGKSTSVEVYAKRTEDAPASFTPESLKLSQFEKQKDTDLVAAASEVTSHLSERNEQVEEVKGEVLPPAVAKESLLSTPARERALSQQLAQLIDEHGDDTNEETVAHRPRIPASLELPVDLLGLSNEDDAPSSPMMSTYPLPGASSATPSATAMVGFCVAPESIRKSNFVHDKVDVGQLFYQYQLKAVSVINDPKSRMSMENVDQFLLS